MLQVRWLAEGKLTEPLSASDLEGGRIDNTDDFQQIKGSEYDCLVGGTGIEPVASSVSGKRSPAELTARRGGSGNRTRVQGFAGPCLSHSAIPPQANP